VTSTSSSTTTSRAPTAQWVNTSDELVVCPVLPTRRISASWRAHDLSVDASTEIVVNFSELYRHGGQWKFRAVGQGYASGLPGIALDLNDWLRWQRTRPASRTGATGDGAASGAAQGCTVHSLPPGLSSHTVEPSGVTVMPYR
jgi:hypothetical protein